MVSADAILETLGSTIGAALTALVAVVLWFSERARERRRDRRAFEEKRQRFVSLLLHSMEQLDQRALELSRQIESQANALRGARADTLNVAHRNIRGILDRYRLQPPGLLTISESHVHYLDQNTLRIIEIISGSMIDIRIEQTDLIAAVRYGSEFGTLIEHCDALAGSIEIMRKNLKAIG